MSVRVTVNSVCSSAAAAAPPLRRPAAIGIAIGIAAAADTPSSDFERLHELRELHHADALDVVDHLLLVHVGHCFRSSKSKS